MAAYTALSLHFGMEHMLQEPGLSMEDNDWTSSSSSFKRRKLQNRVNQRAHRKRKREEAKLCKPTFVEPNATMTKDSTFKTGSQCLTSLTPCERMDIESHTSLKELWGLFYCAVSPQQIVHSSLERVGKLSIAIGGGESEQTITAFRQWVQVQNIASSPRNDRLLVLVKYNVFRALLDNGRTLGFSTAREYLDDDAISPFVGHGNSEESTKLLPGALNPTSVQCQILHHPWLDLLPDPVMRDNLIRARGSYIEEELCSDLIGLFSASTGRNGLIIWGSPWDPSGWEVTESFLKHWGWALRGCNELLTATNVWRQNRGEPLLNLKGILDNVHITRP